MAAFPSAQRVVFLFLLYSAISHLPSLSPTPISYKCSPPIQTVQPNTTRSLLDGLTPHGPPALSSNISVAHKFDGLLQCRLDLHPKSCTSCVQTAKDTLISLCPNSEAAAAWLDGCYMHYYYRTFNSTAEIRVHDTWSNRTHVPNLAQFAYGLDALLLRLAADIRLRSHRGFSSGVTYYGDDHRIYGLAECLRFVRLENCVACVTRAAHEIHTCCSGKVGGIVVDGVCRIRFEGYQFFTSGEPGDGGGPVSVYDDEKEGDDFRGLAIGWSVGAACIFVACLGLWMLRRRITSGFATDIKSTDASGNVVLGDIGVHIQQQIKRHFKDIGVPADVKYIDPTYMIRPFCANASDCILFTVLGQNAVHGVFAGYSGITVGICNSHYVYLPIPEVIAAPKLVEPYS